MPGQIEGVDSGIRRQRLLGESPAIGIAAETMDQDDVFCAISHLGPAQAIAAGFGGLLGASAVDVLRQFSNDTSAFGTVFLFEALLFVAAALMASRVLENGRPPVAAALVPGE